MSIQTPGQRIAIRGLSGSGKTTLAIQLSGLLELPHIEMDELFWKPNWEESTDEEFLPKVEAATKRDKWVICGNYSRTRHLIDPHTDTIIWLDYPFLFVLNRLIKRSWIRGRQGNILWGHSQESIKNSFFNRNGIVWWIFKVRKKQKKSMRNLFSNPEPGKVYIHFTSARQTRDWLRILTEVQSDCTPSS